MREGCLGKSDSEEEGGGVPELRPNGKLGKRQPSPGNAPRVNRTHSNVRRNTVLE